MPFEMNNLRRKLKGRRRRLALRASRGKGKHGVDGIGKKENRAPKGAVHRLIVVDA